MIIRRISLPTESKISVVLGGIACNSLLGELRASNMVRSSGRERFDVEEV